MNRHTGVAGLVTVLALTGCTVSAGGTAMPARSRISAVPLPFTPTITERTNDRNDGTSFEPCTTYTNSELEKLGVDTRTIRDAGFSDSPNFRGCSWTSTDGSGRYSQIVGNDPSLDVYKSRQRQRPWQADRQVGGRTLAVAAERPNGCIAVFVSEKAVVISAVNTTSPRTPSPDLVAECDTAIAWATLAIAKAP